MKGEVRKIMDKGYGFIMGEDHHDYFFHMTSVKYGSFNDLVIGTKVTFRETSTGKGYRAEEIYPDDSSEK